MTINRDALVEKAAHAIIDAEYPDIAWRLIQGKARELRLQQAHAVLDAILPNVQAQTLEDAAERVGKALVNATILRLLAAEYRKVASE